MGGKSSKQKKNKNNKDNANESGENEAVEQKPTENGEGTETEGSKAVDGGTSVDEKPTSDHAPSEDEKPALDHVPSGDDKPADDKAAGGSVPVQNESGDAHDKPTTTESEIKCNSSEIQEIQDTKEPVEPALTAVQSAPITASVTVPAQEEKAASDSTPAVQVTEEAAQIVNGKAPSKLVDELPAEDEKCSADVQAEAVVEVKAEDEKANEALVHLENAPEASEPAEEPLPAPPVQEPLVETEPQKHEAHAGPEPEPEAALPVENSIAAAGDSAAAPSDTAESGAADSAKVVLETGDTAAPGQEQHRPGNNVKLIEFKWEEGGNSVLISGSFNNWTEKIALTKNGEVFSASVDLPAGEYLYKYIVDEQWVVNKNQPVKCDDKGEENNFITVV